MEVDRVCGVQNEMWNIQKAHTSKTGAFCWL